MLNRNVTIQTQELLQIRARTEYLMSRNREFMVTNGYETAKRCFETRGHVTIIGEEGSGKTSIAHQLLRDGSDRCRLMIVNNVTELKLYRTGRQKTLVLIDDVFGKTVYSAADLYRWVEAVENLTGCLTSGRLQVIFTSRKYIFREAMSNVAMRQKSPFKESMVVDLSKKGLSSAERLCLLKMNSKQKGVKVPNKLKRFIDNTSISGFPLSCGLLFQSSEWRDKPTMFIRKPKTCLQDSIRRMAKSKPDSFAVLLLVLLKGGVLNLTDIRETDPDLDMIKTWTKSSDMFAFIRKTQALAPSLVGRFLQCSGQRYSFAHQLIEDGVVYELGLTNPEFLLEHCPTRVLFERIRITVTQEHVPTTQPYSQIFQVVLSDCHHHLMIDRFLSLLARRDFSTVCLHQALADDTIAEQLFRSMKKVSGDNLSHNIHQEDKQYNGTLLHWSVSNPDSIFCEHILQENAYGYNEVRKALLVCCKSGNARALKSIFRFYPNVKLSTQSMFFCFNVLDHIIKYTLLNTAVIFGHKRVVDILLSEVGQDDIQNALCLSCIAGHAHLLQHLVKHGADVNATCRLTELTPLLEACKEGHLRCVKECIRLGADTEATGSSVGSSTPIAEACSMGHEDIVEFLLEQGACLDNTWDTAYRVFKGGCLKFAKELWNRPDHECHIRQIGRNDTLLHAASLFSQDNEENHLAIVRMLVERKADVNAKDYYGRTPILNAASSGGKSIVTYLFNNRASMNVVDRNGQTLLHEAAKGNLLGDSKPNFLQMMKRKTMLTAVNNEGQTPLCRAAAFGQVVSVMTLLAHGAEVNTVGSQERTPLHWAAESGSSDVVLLMLAHGADVNSVDARGKTALLSTSESGNTDIVDVLLANKADANASDATGRTPIKAASACGHTNTVRMLLYHEADVHAADKSQETALHKAACGGYSDTIQVLLENTAEVDAKDGLGRTPLHVAMYSGYSDSAQILLEHRADINALDGEGMTPLHIATANTQYESVQLLLLNNADVNCVSNRGHTDWSHRMYSRRDCIDPVDGENQTPLHVAAEKYDVRIVQLLLENNADVNAADGSGHTALHIASRPHPNMYDIVKVLLDNGADANAACCSRQTPLHMASSEDTNTSDSRFQLNISAMDDEQMMPQFEGTDNAMALANPAEDPDASTSMPNSSSQSTTASLGNGFGITAVANTQKIPLSNDVKDRLASGNVVAETIQLLLDHKANAAVADFQMKTSLHLAVQYSNLQALVKLLQHGVNVDVADASCKTPLHLAAELGHINIVESLLSHKADVDAIDEQGNTPLHLAARTTCDKSVQVLLKYNANVAITNYAKQTPLHIAASTLRNQGILSLLIEHEADLEAIDNDGRTPLDVARDLGNMKYVHKLTHANNQN